MARAQWSILGLTALLLGSGAIARAGWIPDGTPVCTLPGSQHTPRLVPDGSGGVFVVWLDSYDIHLTRLARDGDPASGWPVNGRRACVTPADRRLLSATGDGAGGLVIIWSSPDELYFAGIGLDRDGAVRPGWSADGDVLYRPYLWSENVSTRGNKVVEAASGGNWLIHYLAENLSCHDCVSTLSVCAGYIERPGWPPGNLSTCIVSIPTNQVHFTDVTFGRDNSGALLAAVAVGTGSEPYIQVFSRTARPSSGSISWGTTFQPPDFHPPATSIEGTESGGAFVAGHDRLANGEFAARLLRLTERGRPDGRWPLGGIVLDQSVKQPWPYLVVDDPAGVIVGWWSGANRLPRVAKFDSVGAPFPGWPAGGLTLRDRPDGFVSPVRTSDGAGGARFVWIDDRLDAPGLYSAHVRSDGSSPDPIPNGAPLCTAVGPKSGIAIAASEPGVAIVAWADGRAGNLESDLYVQRLPLDFTVPTLASLADVIARHDQVTLRWFIPGMLESPPEIERSHDSQSWGMLGGTVPEGSGYHLYEDREVRPGDHLSYRVRWLEGGKFVRSGTTNVEVPGAPRLQLAGFDPNPAVGSPRVRLSLVGGWPAHLEAFDMAGRRVASKDLAGRGAGAHTMELVTDGALRPGVYLLRLTEGSRSVAARGIVIH